MKIRLALHSLAFLGLVSLTGCQTSGTPSDVGLRKTHAAEEFRMFKENDGYVVGVPALVAISGGVEVGATAVGAAESAGKLANGAGKAGGGALHWWIHDAPKK